jgi:cytidine deaminase
MFFRNEEAPQAVLPDTAKGMVGVQLQQTPGFLPASVVQQLLQSTGYTIQQLMASLVPSAAQYAIPPISNFKVGAVGLGASGSLALGANIEFVGEALSMCVHGEQAVTANAIAHGETGLQMLAISAAPCGYCRQFLYETSLASSLQILLANTAPVLLTTLLPDAFGPADLGVTTSLMTPQFQPLDLPPGDTVVQAALQAAQVSYAPYSFSYSGVALGTSDGQIFSGSYAENAAFNPSMSPMEAALVSLVMGGSNFGAITEAVLVQVEGATASQIAVSQNVLSSISQVQLNVQIATPAA